MAGEFTCVACGASCREADRFCSQCGRADPANVSAIDSSSDFGANSTFAAGTTLTTGGGPGLAGDASLAPDSVFARRYRIERLLGQGGMGRVYLAVDTTIYEPVALKFVSGGSRSRRDVLDQFKRELKLARKIRHRNVVASFHIGEAEGRAYIVQEYIDADSLSVLLQREGALGEVDCIALLRQVLHGLKAAHDLGIVHRDIKAGNILVNKDRIAFITDFGLALSLADSAGVRIAGTPHYMAPELFAGAPATPATDFYACGVLLFHMLTRRFPFQAATFEDFTGAHRTAQPAPLPATLRVSPATRQLYERLLAKDPRDRPQTAVEVLDVFDGVLALGALRVETDRPIALVAEADAIARSTARDQLETDGYHVEEVATAQQTLDLAFSLSPYLVVVDSNLEGGGEIALSRDASSAIVADILSKHGGLGLCRVLQHDTRLKRVPILVVTPHHNPGIRSAFMLMGAAEVIAKPFTHEEFAAGVRRARQMALARAAEA